MPSRGRIARSPGWRRIVRNRNHCTVPLYQRMFCCMIRTGTAAHIYCCVRTRRAGGVERPGEAKTAIPAPLWHGSAYVPLPLFYFILIYFCPLYPPLSLA